MDKLQITAAFEKHGTDKGPSRHGYQQMYSALFEKVGNVAKMLEVGVRRGRSLAAWLELFPGAEIVGVDIKHHHDIIPAAQGASMILANSTRVSIAEKVGTGYDIIIDDGDHRIDSQWQTFLNLQDCWTKSYVIEDVEGADNEKLLRKRLKSKGFTNIYTYSSKLQDAVKNTKKPEETFGFFAIVVYRE